MVGLGLKRWSVGLCLFAAGAIGACGNSDGASHSGGDGGKAGGVQGGAAGNGHGGAVSGGAAGAPEGGDTQGGEAGSFGGSAGGSGGIAVTGGSAGFTSGGSAGEGGGAGEGGATEVDLQPVGAIPPDKIDLLFVIDNSISMADKQEILRAAVPLLVRRLVTPVCVDVAGNPNGQLASPSGVCSAGEPEFSPLKDFHIGVISSSLGSHGGETCSDTTTNPEYDDKAHLLPTVRAGLATWNNSGFLAWDPEQRAAPPGSNDAAAFVNDFQNMVVAAGEKGCGFESTLEAWYRFLIDPEPPSAVTLNSGKNGVDISAPDAVTLSQRAQFLRPDSLVGIVVLSDENDCSIVDGGQGYLVGAQTLGGTPFRMPRSTSACSVDPNDPCCFFCPTTTVPNGCSPPANDSECMKGSFLTASEDNLNLRCWDQKRRFGIDLLQPIQRYVSGLTDSEVLTRAGAKVQNPLFQAPPGMTHRGPSHVFFLGIVGVPWQDVADDVSLSDSVRLKYLSASELEAQGRFTMMLGAQGARPTDGLMLETNVDRSTLGLGVHPLTGEALAPSSSTNPRQNRVNGHETNIADGADLQYSCIFPLTTPRTCTDSASNCDCRTSDAQYNRALCQPPQGGAAGTTQYYAKAYPGLRQLELVRDFGRITNNAIAASICPKVQMAGMPTTDPNYGYNPAVTALVDRMKVALAPACLSESVPVDASGAIACHVLEVATPEQTGGGACTCAGVGRSAPSATTSAAIRSRLAQSLSCDGAGQPSCESLCVCEVSQLAGSELTACQNDASVPADSAGFCYVDAIRHIGDASLLEDCPADRKRRLRFVGTDIPLPGAASYVFCPR